MKALTILGSTGSIGVTTLDVVARFPDRLRVVALAAGTRVAQLAEQARRFQPRVVAVGAESAVDEFRQEFPDFKGDVVYGPEGLAYCATLPDVDLVVSALVGAIGLVPTLRAVESGKAVALANKEVLVAAGSLVTECARRSGATLWPLDSEHNAIFQVLQGHRREDVRRLILTASGGPFLRTPKTKLADVGPAEALKHPTWKMGAKITVDSATLMNKGLEVIEAHWLFGLDPSKIEVVIHPQSIVHSLVEYVDGSVLAQLGVPDMSIPIAYVLGHPERLPLNYLPRLDLAGAGKLEFESPDVERFPCLTLAYQALALGGTAPAVLNAANEEAVAAFLAGRAKFLDIPRVIQSVLHNHDPQVIDCLETVLRADQWARAKAHEIMR
ncbi:MAG: 1-deoxy-D-xylulose 5-phosphate reductoisomerase [Candidatus Binatia bacterium]|nr:MAG: 1-deoxy-D-xylulose 5-phosphate reductoisomerase [Candidatus Binatia bacterium]